LNQLPGHGEPLLRGECRVECIAYVTEGASGGFLDERLRAPEAEAGSSDPQPALTGPLDFLSKGHLVLADTTLLPDARRLELQLGVESVNPGLGQRSASNGELLPLGEVVRVLRKGAAVGFAERNRQGIPRRR